MPSDKPMIEKARDYAQEHPWEPGKHSTDLVKDCDDHIINRMAAFATQQVEECAKIADKAGCNLVAAAIRSRKESR